MKKVILAYSGGLDTSCCIRWLKDRGFDVICFSADLGSEFDPKDLKERALKTGASKIYIRDLKEEFAGEYILRALKASAIYESKYVLSTALARPLIAKHLVEIAKLENAEFVAHGCTAKGNDQVRFEATIEFLAPHLKIIAPLREWELKSREDELEYAKKHNVLVKATEEKLYSIDKNIWGVSIEGALLEDLTIEPPKNSYYFVKSPFDAQEEPTYLEITFSNGEPIKLNGKRINLVKLIEKLNEIGAMHAIGRTDLIEDRLVGIKSREIYEAPAAWILHTAHKEIESLVLDRELLAFKEIVSAKYSQLIYQGLWFTTFREALDNFIESTQRFVDGTVGLKLYKGNIIVTKRTSKFSLYDIKLSSYGRADKFDRSLATGFIKLWTLPYRRSLSWGKKK